MIDWENGVQAAMPVWTTVELWCLSMSNLVVIRAAHPSGADDRCSKLLHTDAPLTMSYIDRFPAVAWRTRDGVQRLDAGHAVLLRSLSPMVLQCQPRPGLRHHTSAGTFGL